MDRLKDKVSIITGAGSGIGKGMAQLFAREGSAVVVADFVPEAGMETVRLIQEAGGRALFVKTDVSNAESVNEMVAAAVKEFGKLDVLVNVAGISAGDTTDITKCPDEVFDRIIAVNLKGTYLCCKSAIPEMIKNRGGSIINIASMAAITMAPRAAYAASKGGVVALTKSLALQWGYYNIRVNAICPGPIETPMSNATREAGVYKGPLIESCLKNYSRGTPEDIGYAAVYLASDESSYVTSDIIVVDGGTMRIRAEQFIPAEPAYPEV
jgi:NAD(P)-dependent dehydrogenase (short-subunit alcohol dehydrogenase family)